MRNNRQLLLVTLVLMVCLIVPEVFANSHLVAQSTAPFSIEVEPEKATVKAGEEITYNIKITADEGFEEDIFIVLEIEALSYYELFELGNQSPPYPKEFQYTLPIPSDVPVDVTADASIQCARAIKSSSAAGGILGYIIRAIQSILNVISNLFKRK